jgi:hypothetical protein
LIPEQEIEKPAQQYDSDPEQVRVFLHGYLHIDFPQNSRAILAKFIKSYQLSLSITISLEDNSAY